MLYTLKKKTFFYPSVFLSSLFKVYKKIVKFSFTPTKNILVFSFSFWFPLIQRIDHYTSIILKEYLFTGSLVRMCWVKSRSSFSFNIFLLTLIFKPLYFVKMCPIFVSPAFLHFKKHQSFPLNLVTFRHKST